MLKRLTQNGSNKGRLFLYPLGLVLAAGLLYGGFFYEAAPDQGSLLTSANFLAQVGKYDEAEEQVQKVLEQDPDCLYSHLILGLITERRGEFDRAIKVYSRANDLSDDEELSRDLELSVADLYRRKGDLNEAAKLLAKIETTEFSAGKVLKAQGLVARDQGRLEDALKLFRKCRPKFEQRDATDIAMLEAGVLIDMDRRAEAATLIDELSQQQKRVWPMWPSLARACLEAGDRQGAEKALAKYLALDEHGTKRLQKNEYWSERVNEQGHLAE